MRKVGVFNEKYIYYFFPVPVGVLQADSGVIRDSGQIFRLFCHEAQRVFHDRLINKEDKRYFNTILSEMAQKHFSQVWLVISCIEIPGMVVRIDLLLLGSALYVNL